MESLQIENSALDLLATMGSETSLRYALQLLAPCGILAQTSNRKEIGINDVDEAKLLFLDAKRSTKILETSANYL